MNSKLKFLLDVYLTEVKFLIMPDDNETSYNVFTSPKAIFMDTLPIPTTKCSWPLVDRIM